MTNVSLSNTELHWHRRPIALMNFLHNVSKCYLKAKSKSHLQSNTFIKKTRMNRIC